MYALAEEGVAFRKVRYPERQTVMPTIFGRLKILICDSPLEFDSLLPKPKLDVLRDREVGPKGNRATHDNQSVTALSPFI
jgi:hypothetical protein